MSSIAKSSISISKKDLTKSRIPPVAARNVVFYHKATAGDLSINLNALNMPSAEMPTAVQATADEISGARLLINKKNLKLVSSVKGELIQHIDYIVTSSYNIQLIGDIFASGAEVDEIFIGTITAAPISDLVVASAKSVDKTYTLAVGQTTLNLGREYQVGVNPNDNVGSIKVFVNGVLARRDVDYQEVDSGNGYGTTIEFFAAPPTEPYQIVVDFGVMSITDNNALGTIESHAGAIKKIADDLAVLAGTSANDYLNANPSEVERRVFGDTVLNLNSKYDTTQNLSQYTKTKWQMKTLPSTTGATGVISTLSFNNLVIGKTYRATMKVALSSSAIFDAGMTCNGIYVLRVYSGLGNATMSVSAPFVATATTLLFNIVTNGTNLIGDGSINGSFSVIEELPNHELTTQWT